MKEKHMCRITSVVFWGGCLITLIGVIGVFARFTDNDGALAITGAILLSSSMIVKTFSEQTG